jgi:hypothetical protein
MVMQSKNESEGATAIVRAAMDLQSLLQGRPYGVVPSSDVGVVHPLKFSVRKTLEELRDQIDRYLATE